MYLAHSILYLQLLNSQEESRKFNEFQEIYRYDLSIRIWTECTKSAWLSLMEAYEYGMRSGTHFLNRWKLNALSRRRVVISRKCADWWNNSDVQMQRCESVVWCLLINCEVYILAGFVREVLQQLVLPKWHSILIRNNWRNWRDKRLYKDV